jgi:hypothetical protein
MFPETWQLFVPWRRSTGVARNEVQNEQKSGRPFEAARIGFPVAAVRPRHDPY